MTKKLKRTITITPRNWGAKYLAVKGSEKMCCLGNYLRSCGMHKEQLNGHRMPDDVCFYKSELPAESQWLVDESRQNSFDASELSVANDRYFIGWMTFRNAKYIITRIFAKHGVKVVFEGNFPEHK